MLVYIDISDLSYKYHTNIDRSSKTYLTCTKPFSSYHNYHFLKFFSGNGCCAEYSWNEPLKTCESIFHNT